MSLAFPRSLNGTLNNSYLGNGIVQPYRGATTRSYAPQMSTPIMSSAIVPVQRAPIMSSAIVPVQTAPMMMQTAPTALMGSVPSYGYSSYAMQPYQMMPSKEAVEGELKDIAKRNLDVKYKEAAQKVPLADIATRQKALAARKSQLDVATKVMKLEELRQKQVMTGRSNQLAIQSAQFDVEDAQLKCEQQRIEAGDQLDREKAAVAAATAGTAIKKAELDAITAQHDKMEAEHKKQQDAIKAHHDKMEAEHKKQQDAIKAHHDAMIAQQAAHQASASAHQASAQQAAHQASASADHASQGAS